MLVINHNATLFSLTCDGLMTCAGFISFSSLSLLFSCYELKFGAFFITKSVFVGRWRGPWITVTLTCFLRTQTRLQMSSLAGIKTSDNICVECKCGLKRQRRGMGKMAAFYSCQKPNRWWLEKQFSEHKHFTSIRVSTKICLCDN